MPGEAGGFYLAAEAEAQGQEAGEEVFAPSDHAGEAPAQPSHVDPEGGCLVHEGLEGEPAAPGSELREWGGKGEPSRPQERHDCPAPSSGRSVAGAPRRRPDVAPSPRKPLRGARAAAGRFHPGDFLWLLPLSSPWRDSLLLPASRRPGGGRRHPGNFRGPGASQERLSGQGRGGARRQAPTCEKGEEGAAAVGAWAAVGAALCSKLQ